MNKIYVIALSERFQDRLKQYKISAESKEQALQSALVSYDSVVAEKLTEDKSILELEEILDLANIDYKIISF